MKMLNMANYFSNIVIRTVFIIKPSKPRPSAKKRMKVPNLPALDFLARSQTIKTMKPINAPTQM